MIKICPACFYPLSKHVTKEKVLFCTNCETEWDKSIIEKEKKPCPRCGDTSHSMCGEFPVYEAPKYIQELGRSIRGKHKTRAYIRMTRAGVEILLTVNLKSRTVAGMLTEIMEAVGEIDAGGMVIDSINFCEVVE